MCDHFVELVLKGLIAIREFRIVKNKLSTTDLVFVELCQTCALKSSFIEMINLKKANGMFL